MGRGVRFPGIGEHPIWLVLFRFNGHTAGGEGFTGILADPLGAAVAQTGHFVTFTIVTFDSASCHGYRGFRGFLPWSAGVSSSR